MTPWQTPAPPSVHGRPVPTAAWAVMAMEMAAGFVLASILMPRERGWSLLDPLAVVLLLLLGYLAVHRGRVPDDPRLRLVLGFLAAVLVRAPLTPLPTLQPEAPFVAAAFTWAWWLLWPALLGLLFWWRGGYLADGELDSTSVRNELMLLGVGTLAMLTVFQGRTLLHPTVSLLTVAVFLLAGLIGMGAARQDDTGTPGQAPARLLVVATVVGFFVAAGLVVAILRPPVVAAIGSVVGEVLRVVVAVLVVILRILLLPLSWLNFQMPELPSREGSDPPAGLPEGTEQGVVAEWLLWVVVGLSVLVAVAFVVLVLWILFTVLAPGWFRVRGSNARAPVAVEDTDGLSEDAQGLLGRLLGRFRGAGPRPARAPLYGDALDPRAAYRLLVRWARDRGIRRARVETVEEFRGNLAARAPEGSEAYAAITRLYQHDRYGHLPATEPDLVRLRQSVARLRTLQPPD